MTFLAECQIFLTFSERQGFSDSDRSVLGRAIGKNSDLPTILPKVLKAAFFKPLVRDAWLSADSLMSLENRRQLGFFATANTEISKIVGKSDYLPPS